MSYPPQYGPQGQPPDQPGPPPAPEHSPAPPPFSGVPPQQPVGGFAPPPPPPKKKGRLAGILGVVAVVVVVIGIRVVGNVAQDAIDEIDAPERTTNGEVTESGTLGPLSLKVGDCYHNDISTTDTTETVRNIEAIPCTQQHNAQVISETTMSGSYPSTEQFLAKCQEQFESWAKSHSDVYQALGQRDPKIGVSVFFPQIGQWNSAGSNRITCSLVSSTGDLGDKLPTS